MYFLVSFGLILSDYGYILLILLFFSVFVKYLLSMDVICSQCDKIFKTPGKLRVHNRIQTKDIPLTCFYCDKVFSWPGDLKKDQIKHTKERLFTCSQCGKTYSWSIQLKTHKKYIGKNMFACSHFSNFMNMNYINLPCQYPFFTCFTFFV